MATKKAPPAPPNGRTPALLTWKRRPIKKRLSALDLRAAMAAAEKERGHALDMTIGLTLIDLVAFVEAACEDAFAQGKVAERMESL